MSYRVFARKYRPQRFEEVIGQEHITRTLQNAIKGGRLAQAYLFVGPRGVGKTSTARILAKALNCQAGPTDNPCGTCDACIEIAEGRSLDVLEIDGASNNSVESVRTLRENAAYAPARGPYKVYLIDEVHMLTTAAFNALLKTLEEPPEHVKFLFATTEAQKVPATILSRCQRFDLCRLTPGLIASHLLYIAGEEKITLEQGAAESIARGADGALRDAESMLDQVIAFCGTSISAADVHQVFGFTPRETVLELARALIGRDTPAALALLTAQSDAGKDLSRMLADLIALLRDVLISKVHPLAEATDESLLGEAIPQEKLLVLLDHFGEAEGRLRWATDKKLQLDVAVIKSVHLLEEASLSDVLDVLAALRGGVEQNAMPPRSVPKVSDAIAAPAKVPSPPILKAPEPLERVEKKTTEVVEPVVLKSPVTLATSAPELESSGTPALSLEIPPSRAGSDPWYPVAMELAADSPLKFGWVEDGCFTGRTGNVVSVEFPASLEQQTKTLFWPQGIRKIEELLSARLGGKITLECRFSGAELPVEPEPERPHAPDSKQPAKSDSSSQPAEPKTEPAVPAISPEELEEFKNDPLIRKALEIFKAEIANMPPLTP